MRYSVVIAERDEPDLRNTVADIKANNSPDGVVVISDPRGRGPQACRHEGITKAAMGGADVVVVMDGHMRTQPSALDAAAAYVAANPSTVACLTCHHTPNLDWESQPMRGAWLSWEDKTEEMNNKYAFSGKWRKGLPIGDIGCLMGACYVFSVDWYSDGVRQPWQRGLAWGCDEEWLSCATWLRGGRVVALPWRVWHQSKTTAKNPIRYSQLQRLAIYAEKLRLLQALPMTNAERNQQARWLFGGVHGDGDHAIAQMADRHRDWCGEYRDFLASGPMPWAEFRAKIVDEETVKMAKMQELREMAAKAGITVPFGCKKTELEQMLGGAAGAAAFDAKAEKARKMAAEPPKSRANWGPNEANQAGERACRHCGSVDTVTTKTRASGRRVVRYRHCNGCRRNFTTMEVVQIFKPEISHKKHR